MSNQMIINTKAEKNTISRMIYGHFAEHLGHCIYGGIWVGRDSPIANTHGIRNDVVDALRKIRIPCLRWPGGCFADEYHWKDGIGTYENRKSMINSHWGGIVENNHFGTHEFFDLCELLGTEPYICGNVGSGTVREMSEWVEYMTFDGTSPLADLRRANGRSKPWKLRYFGVGNENWGGGGRMRAEYYADVFNRYSLYAHDLGDNRLFRIAAGPRNDNYHWTEVLMREAGLFMDGLALHYYTRLGDPVVEVDMPDGNRRYTQRPGVSRTSATVFGEKEWFGTMQSAIRTETLIENHSHIMDQYDPNKRVALIVDEWGTWFDAEPGTNPAFLYQQNTLRDALVAGTSLNIFNNHSDRVRMANIAQMVNVLQAVILTKDEQMILTPTYHVFDMYKVHQGARLLDFAILSDDYSYDGESLKQINVSASKDANDDINITICNIDPNKGAHIVCHLDDAAGIRSVEGTILTSADMTAHNTFDRPDAVTPQKFNGFRFMSGTLTIDMPSQSVILLTLHS